MENEEQKIDQKPPFMPNQTLLLIGGLALATIVLLFLAFYNSMPKPPAKKAPAKILQTFLKIAQPIASSSAYLASVELSTERSKITVVQLNLSFDPKILGKVDINPGTVFDNPTIILKDIDTVNGKISYTLGIGLGQYPVNGNGTVAIISFTPLVSSGTTNIDFTPKNQVNAAGQTQSILTSTKGIQFSFAPAPTPTIREYTREGISPRQ